MRLAFGILLSLTILFPLGAYAQKEKCPAGCFCLNDGEYELRGNYAPGETGYCSSKTAIQFPSNWGSELYCSDTEVINDNLTTSATPQLPIYYYLSEFSEFYTAELGGYGLLNGNFVYFNDCNLYDNMGKIQKADSIFQCPYHFPHSAEGSKSLGDCFKYDINGNKIYYGSESKIECAEGTYLPTGTTTCKSCNASKNQVCPGGRFAKSEIKNQGLKVNCNPGEFLPANATECSTCDTENYQCLGGIYDASLMQDQGRTPIQNNGYIPGGDRPFIVCQPGFYVPANTTTCTACTGDNICLGGIFYADTHYNTDRGATPCNFGKANATHTECINQTTKPSLMAKQSDNNANIITTSFPKPTSINTYADEPNKETITSAQPTQNKNTQLPIPSATAFSWDKLDDASLFTPSIDAKSATPIRTRVTTLNASDTRSRTVINNTNRTIRQDKTNKSRQDVTPKKTSRPTSGKNTSKNLSSTTSQHPK